MHRTPGIVLDSSYSICVGPIICVHFTEERAKFRDGCLDRREKKKHGHSEASSIPQGHTSEQIAWAHAHLTHVGQDWSQ